MDDSQQAITLPDVVVTPDETPNFQDSLSLATGGALDPKSLPPLIAPLDAPSAQRIADYAAIVGANPPRAPLDKPMPDYSPAVTNLSPATRDEYSAALLNGEADGPQDFSEQFMGAAWSAAHDLAPPTLDDTSSDRAAQVTGAAAAVAAQLPTHEDLIDHAAALSQEAYGTVTPDLVDPIKQNMMDHWADTGESVQQQYQRAQTDPNFNEFITMPQPAPTAPDPSTLEHIEAAYDNLPAIVRYAPFGAGAFPMTMGEKLAPHIEGILSSMTPEAYMEEEKRIIERGAVRYDTATGRELKPDEKTDSEQTLMPGEKFTAGNGNHVSNEAGPVTAQELAGFVSAHILGTASPRPVGALGAGVAVPNKAAMTDLAQRMYGAPTWGAILRRGAVKLWNGGDASLYDENVAAKKWVQAGAIGSDDATARAAAVFANELSTFRKAVNPLLDDWWKYIQERQANVKAVEADRQAWVAAGGDPAKFSPVNPLGANPLPKPQLQLFLDYAQGRSTGTVLRSQLQPELQDLADVVRERMQANQKRMSELKPPPDAPEGWTGLDGWKEDYLHHEWTRPQQAAKIFPAGHQGTLGGAMQRKVFPTWSDGIDAGLTPRFRNPIDGILHHDIGVQAYLNSHELLQDSRELGYVRYSKGGPPKDRPGWRELSGRSSVLGVNKGGGIQRAYAAPGFARSYNLWVGKGFQNWSGIGPDLQTAVNAFTKASNASVGMLFALSGYHLRNLLKGTVATAIGNSMGNAVRGRGMQAVRDLGMPAEIFSTTSAGHQLQWHYLHPDMPVSDPQFNPLWARVANALEGTGIRIAPGGRQIQYRVTGGIQQNFWTAFKQGGIKQGIKEDLAHITDTKNPVIAGTRALGFAAHEMGKVMETLMAPVFDHGVPLMKAQMMADEAKSLIRSHPNISEEQLTAQLREVAKAAENRYGMVNQDTLFWPREVKQTLNALSLSFSWAYGTLRSMGQGARDIASGHLLSPNARFLMAYPVAMALLNTIQSYVNTRTGPQSMKELVSPRTGGTNPDGTTQFELTPGEEKEPLQLIHDFMTGAGPMGYLGRKTNAVARGTADIANSLYQLIRGESPAWNKVYKDVMGTMPIPLQFRPTRGSGIGWWGAFLGDRAASPWWSEPDQYQQWQDKAKGLADYKAKISDYYRDQDLAEPTGVEKPVYPSSGGGSTARAPREGAGATDYGGARQPRQGRSGGHTRAPASKATDY